MKFMVYKPLLHPEHCTSPRTSNEGMKIFALVVRNCGKKYHADHKMFMLNENTTL